jgi:predicted O-linked N-acetylglucosamine transferase (SPINDLY family)
MKYADVFLDTIGFSGFNTAMQAMECSLPVVTREGRFMRGRLASGILRRTGLTELIAENESDYVTIVVRLVKDADYRRQIRHRIESTRHTLSGDLAPVRALENFLINVAKQS